MVVGLSGRERVIHVGCGQGSVTAFADSVTGFACHAEQIGELDAGGEMIKLAIAAAQRRESST